MFLRSLPLARFGTADETKYRRHLNAATQALASKLPGPNTWGLARKLVNMFLRDCAYNAYLRSAYGLGRSEAFMEVPLDSFTIKEIGRQAGLPPVKLGMLSQEVSDQYQRAARDWAKQRKHRTVHLDAVVYGERSGY